jgi:hypothetical protein
MPLVPYQLGLTEKGQQAINANSSFPSQLMAREQFASLVRFPTLMVEISGSKSARERKL